MRTATRIATTIIGFVALIPATAGVAEAQEATPDLARTQTLTQAKNGGGTGRTQGSQNASAVRRLGPGDGTGNQGVKPENGAGNGVPAGAGSAANANQSAASRQTKNTTETRAQKKAAKQAKKQAARNARQATGTRTRQRLRDLAGSGAGSCSGTGSGSQRRAGGSGGRPK